MTEDEEKIRRGWLILTIVRCIIVILLRVYEWKLSSIFLIIIYLLITDTLIYCAYKKLGTTFLKICLVIGLIKSILNFAGLVAFYHASPGLFVLNFCVFMPIGLVWYYLSFKLIKINERPKVTISS